MSLFSDNGRLTLEQKLRAGHVTRWHIVRTARAQTIAEHMYRVWVYTGALSEALDLPMGERDLLLHIALIHDRHEVLMGDVPTPGKTMIEGSDRKGALEAAGRSIDGEYGKLMAVLNNIYPDNIHVLKFADLLEAADFLGVEGIGPHAEEAFASLLTPLVKQFIVLSELYVGKRQALYDILQTAINAARLRGWSTT